MRNWPGIVALYDVPKLYYRFSIKIFENLKACYKYLNSLDPQDILTFESSSFETIQPVSLRIF